MEWASCPVLPSVKVELVGENTVILNQDLWREFTFTIPEDLP